MRVVIVGGVAAGMSAATRLRRLDETAEILVLEAGEHVSFANCGLPYHVGGVIPERAALLRDADGLARRFRLDIRTRHRVTAIDREAKRLRVEADGTASEERYDVLVLAQGAEPDALPADGSVPVHALRSVDDMDGIVRVVESGARSAVVVGGGYIGLETAENLVRRGLAVALVARGDQVLHTLDPEMAAPVHRVLQDAGVDLRFGAAATGVVDGAVVLEGGERLPADLVVDATGVAPRSEPAHAAGLELGPTGGIAVDARHRTSDPAILAAGDAVEKRDAVDGGPVLVALAGLANRHGRSIADVIAGEPEDAAPAIGTAIVQVFGLAVATLGWTERRLLAAGRAHRVLHTHPAQHAGYYPGATPLSIKLLVDAETDQVLGAQITGRDGVDKRIDVLATAIAGGIPASALSRLELAYAPQFGSAKDPVNLLGYVAGNLASGAAATVQWHELPGLQRSGWTLVDVRTPQEFAAGAIPGAVNVPLDDLRERHGELPAERLVVHCQVGQRGATAARLLNQLGHAAANLDGGYRTWRDAEATRRHETEAAA
ncbi:FAD-dependent oxidoreductase [Amnibacterium setariae]|uniref:CoA-disulfide reductase n=1 Tax=Amnibacterium setariae TaxID=2306585 RepID=A0A3A1U4E8_9MICO|nr:FAD-dependent oxidoreductase [Amnibacterium setariae]RIX31243.1 CoA-disulfide reductase [Amnibacterium setariae]